MADANRETTDFIGENEQNVAIHVHFFDLRRYFRQSTQKTGAEIRLHMIATQSGQLALFSQCVMAKPVYGPVVVPLSAAR